MNRSFLAPLQLQKQFVRNLLYGKKQKPNNQPRTKKIYHRVGNAKQFECITFYPKDDFQLPEKLPDPPKLFRVQRFAPLRHRIYWERKILFDFGLINSTSDVAVVKNTPQNNVLLWKIKHLVSVEPITFPYGEPTEEDIKHTNLKESGECIVHKKIGIDEKILLEKRIEATEQFLNDPRKLDKDTLKNEALLKWNRNY